MLSLRQISTDPLREIDRLESDMNRMIRGLSSSLPQGGMSELISWNPVMDIKTTDREMMINMELPGVRKEDVNIEIDRVSYCLVIKKFHHFMTNLTKIFCKIHSPQMSPSNCLIGSIDY